MVKENKKIKGATECDYNGIHFRSKLEMNIFKVLEEQKVEPKHEPIKFHIWNGFKPSFPFYIKDKKTKLFGIDNTKLIDITYTPDIVFNWKDDYVVYVEVKGGMENDVFPYKRKLFRKYLEQSYNDSERFPIYAQVGSKREALELLKILKDNYNEKKPV